MAEKILIIDDELNNLDVLQARLRANNFDVLTCEDPLRGLKIAEAENPDIVLLDINMPKMNGFEVCRRLKRDYSTAHIPIVLLTCMDDISYKVEGLEGGADDYLVKDQIDHKEIAARIRSILRRVKSNLSANPLTVLPGNDEIIRTISTCIRSGKSFSVVYVDIDNFKPYNDCYGFSKGDQVILMVGKVLRDAVKANGSAGDFLGHIGGDDFVVISEPHKVRKIAAVAVETVSRKAPDFYSERDKLHNGIEGFDRHGVKRFFPFFGITAAVVDIDPTRAAVTPDQIATMASRIKKKLKQAGGKTVGGYESLMTKKQPTRK